MTAAPIKPMDLILDYESAAVWNENAVSHGLLPIWVIYYNTTDYPGLYIARPISSSWKWVPSQTAADRGDIFVHKYSAVLVAESLPAIRALLPGGRALYQIPRWDEDCETSIVEVWMS